MFLQLLTLTWKHGRLLNDEAWLWHRLAWNVSPQKVSYTSVTRCPSFFPGLSEQIYVTHLNVTFTITLFPFFTIFNMIIVMLSYAYHHILFHLTHYEALAPVTYPLACQRRDKSLFSEELREADHFFFLHKVPGGKNATLVALPVRSVGGGLLYNNRPLSPGKNSDDVGAWTHTRVLVWGFLKITLTLFSTVLMIWRRFWTFPPISQGNSEWIRHIYGTAIDVCWFKCRLLMRPFGPWRRYDLYWVTF